jgi:Baseplate J-like protein
MTPIVPKIDPRTAADIAASVRRLLQKDAGFDAAKDTTGVSAALINIFARYAEIIIERLNQAPQKNYLAFLDHLGAALLPPQPARAPLTFSLAAGSAVDGVAPAGTQVAAPPAEDETEPVIFETERTLVVTAAQLDALFVREPEADRYADRRGLVAEQASVGESLFEGETPIDHILYVGDREFFNLPNLSNAQLVATFDNIAQDEMEIRWERWDGESWVEIKTQKTSAGNVRQTFVFGSLAPIPLSEVNGLESRWARGRLLTPITLSDDKQANKVRAGQLPSITSMQLSGDIKGDSLTAEHSFTNQFPVDTSKEFFPLGEKPRVGDAWLIAQSEAFSQPGVRITLDITLAGSVRTDGRPALKWEFWNGKAWKPFTAVTAEPKNGEVQDKTENLTKSGKVLLQLPGPSDSPPGPPAPREINGIENSWLRVRLSGGDYGKDARYVELTSPPSSPIGFVVLPPTFAPPVISSIGISYVGKKSAEPDIRMAYNHFDYVIPNPQEHLKPFLAVATAGAESRPALYLGFTLPKGGRFRQNAISLYVSVVEHLFGEASATAAGRPKLEWECWNGKLWERLVVKDDSAALTRSGLIEFLPPADFPEREEFGLRRHWLRVRWEEGQYRFKPRARRALLNTTMATQSVTQREEILGSSDGGKNQKFRATHAPILAGQRLEVREPEQPPAAEQRAIKTEEGEDAIKVTPDTAGRPKEVWVRWREVADFYGSGPRDRHYALDHLTGDVRFGDGVNGLIPPVGAGNLRLAQYRTGGGSVGNRPAGTIVQLKTTVPYVDKVTNHEAAAGGADAESLDSLLDRAPRTIRHNYRAATVEDFEDVAMLASPEVARAKCVPLRNLISHPLDKNAPVDPLSGLRELRGHVSVIVVPRSTATKPLPSLELLERVQDYLNARSMPTARVWVTGPLYLRVDVETEIALVSLEGAGAVEQEARGRLTAFLHPLTGGLDRKGWDFGREPHLSDLYALIEAVPGVDHVNSLIRTERVDEGDIAAFGIDTNTAVDDVKKTGRFLVCSGAHTIRLKFEEE